MKVILGPFSSESVDVQQAIKCVCKVPDDCDVLSEVTCFPGGNPRLPWYFYSAHADTFIRKRLFLKKMIFLYRFFPEAVSEFAKSSIKNESNTGDRINGRRSILISRTQKETLSWSHERICGRDAESSPLYNFIVNGDDYMTRHQGSFGRTAESISESCSFYFAKRKGGEMDRGSQPDKGCWLQDQQMPRVQNLQYCRSVKREM